MDSLKVAVVTGASAGIGEATARVLAKAGFTVFVGARRLSRLEALAAEIGGTALPLDVTDTASVEAFAAALPEQVQVLVNNAGGALGLEPIVEFDEKHWLDMYQTNVLGLVRVSRALFGRLEASGAGHVVNLGSIAGLEAYPGGAGYTAVKHGVRAVSETMRLEWLGKPIRVSEIDPGLVETEFSLVRFAGDAERARAVYAGLQPLTAADIAEAVRWVVTLPPHVNIDQLVIKPLAQARAILVHREKTG
ncbi:SDR family NAD(P)-dependent oxidoreductase [Gloeobacter kilaueensis]|uniref:Short-chain dehydrogenase/reductase SDR n=1 Tax=Gloeobacter kilaueensis (strain ATCC BAA-2537 / CCAP 1431/1 / ULC 316 / JS1) TaxID=1183438 RepID=U5QFJ1_GLOK1|nr:SDR family NAD(P)-dependent oxidoreductase [Gloeobacter kilaueensis]AGY57737.1 short-chain dehydrogenase/reductase SDR [Gloeobacter kilaueensis JS1]